MLIFCKQSQMGAKFSGAHLFILYDQHFGIKGVQSSVAK